MENVFVSIDWDFFVRDPAMSPWLDHKYVDFVKRLGILYCLDCDEQYGKIGGTMLAK